VTATARSAAVGGKTGVCVLCVLAGARSPLLAAWVRAPLLLGGRLRLECGRPGRGDDRLPATRARDQRFPDGIEAGGAAGRIGSSRARGHGRRRAAGRGLHPHVGLDRADVGRTERRSCQRRQGAAVRDRHHAIGEERGEGSRGGPWTRTCRARRVARHRNASTRFRRPNAQRVFISRSPLGERAST
jgi:hypothetical protein